MADKKGLGIALLAGAAVGGFFLWNYFKKGGPSPDNPSGFIISKLYLSQAGDIIQFPNPGEEFNVVVVGKNNGNESVEGYCDISNTDTQEVVFSESDVVPSKEIKTFTYSTVMPETILNLLIETGRVVNGERIKDHSWPLQLIAQIINVLGVGAEPITSIPGEGFKGLISTQNDYDDQTVDVLWAYGTSDPSTSSFSLVSFFIDENITFPGQSSYVYRTPSLTTPDTPGTWDLLGIIAGDISFDGTGIVVVDQHGLGLVAEDAWTISGVPGGNIQIAMVGVGSPT